MVMAMLPMAGIELRSFILALRTRDQDLYGSEQDDSGEEEPPLEAINE